MTHRSDFIQRDQTSNEHFLLSKTHPHEEVQIDPPDIISIDRLQKEFPDLLTGDEFLKAASNKLEAIHQFSAFIISLDNIHTLIDPNGMMLDVVKSLDELCKLHPGLWGLSENTMPACFLMEKNAADCEKIAKELQQKLSNTHSETVSIGIAAYPTLSYQKDRILDNAKKALDHALFFGPNSCVAFDSVSLNISADTYYQNGDLDRAIGEYRLALMLDENNINVHNSLGVCYGIKEWLNQALEEFKTAMRLDPGEIMPVYNAGYVHFLKKEFSEALEYFLNAERIDSSVFELAIQTGRVYLELNQPGTAKNYFETATRLNLKSAAAFRLLGECYTALDRISDATVAYKTSLKLNPHDSSALSSLGYLYEVQEKNADIALMFCRQAVNNEPEKGLYHHRLGRLYLNRNRLEEALDEFQKAHQVGHDSREYMTKTLKLIKATA